MSVFKPFLSSDIIISPLEVNKSFSFKGAHNFTASDVGIDRHLGQNITNSLFTLTDPPTGQISTQYQRLVYNSIKQLYYSNFLSSSYGDTVNTASLIPGKDIEGNDYVGTPQNNSYYNFFETDLNFAKNFKTGSDSYVGVISIPSKLFGNKIQPLSFSIISDSGSITDDGQGNLIYSSSIIGNIIYSHGLAIINGGPAGGYGSTLYGGGLYGGVSLPSFIQNFITSSNVTCSFSSSLTIYETQYKCTIRENEFNYSLNPSLISGSQDGTVYNFVTGSDFTPYLTSVGLYNDNQELLAITKLSSPLPVSNTTDLNIIINLDR